MGRAEGRGRGTRRYKGDKVYKGGDGKESETAAVAR